MAPIINNTVPTIPTSVITTMDNISVSYGVIITQHQPGNTKPINARVPPEQKSTVENVWPRFLLLLSIRLTRYRRPTFATGSIQARLLLYPNFVVDAYELPIYLSFFVDKGPTKIFGSRTDACVEPPKTIPAYAFLL
jgi:hypothetical protein